MFTLHTSIELPIAHCLYRGAYSGLCCGNVYRDLIDDGEKERYDLGSKIFPIVHGHNYNITIKLSSNELNKDGMVIDFKKMKKVIHSYFDQYDHSLILTSDNPLCQAYLDNFKENNIDITRVRLFIWEENPTAEYMSKYWCEAVEKLFKDEGLKVDKISVVVEETAKNTCEYIKEN